MSLTQKHNQTVCIIDLPWAVVRPMFERLLRFWPLGKDGLARPQETMMQYAELC